jgi:single-strand DNA-binding protein
MASFNRVILIGNLGQDPELRHTQNQTAVCTLNIATTDYKTGQDGQRQEFTEWHRVVVWGRQAENAGKYLSKGRSCMVEGRLQTRSWEDKSGQKRYTTEIVAQNVQFLGGGGAQRADRPASNHQSGGYDQDQMGGSDMGAMSMGAPDTPGLDDIPF